MIARNETETAATRPKAREHSYSTVLVLACLVLFGASHFNRSALWPILLFLLMFCGLRLRIADVFLLGLVCGLIASFREIAFMNGLWPLPLVSALAVTLVAGRIAGFTAGAFDWIRKGDFGGRQIAIVAAVSIIAGISLFLWYVVAKPDLTDLTVRIPRVSPVVLAAAGLFFSVANAVCEECIWRGMIFSALERALMPGVAVILIQALSFGAAHVHGFPRGLSGVVLATLYGCILGSFRQYSKGLLAPISAHIFADGAIYSILAYTALTG